MSCQEAGRNTPAPTWLPKFSAGSTWSFNLVRGGQFLDGLDTRDNDEQLRDWVLRSLLLASGTAKTSATALAGQPVWRGNGALGDPSSLAHGAARWAVVGNQDVVALVPQEPASQRERRVGTLLDEIRSSYGVLGATVHVFEYSIESGYRVTLHRLPSVSIADYFNPTHEYHKAVIRNVRDLQQFLEATADLIAAHPEGDHLIVEGRSSISGENGGFQLIHAAELYQADQPWRESEARIAALIDAFNSKWHVIRYESEAQRRSLESQAASEKRALDNKIKQESERIGLRSVCGFSLDPQPPLAVRPNFQLARYDCNLSGTETGMVLFYSDLVAKLWALDIAESFPWHITGFQPQTHISIPQDELNRMEAYPRTRIWFGPRSGTFHLNDGGLIFAPVSTHVFAKSSSAPGSPEQRPTAAAAHFVDWWNDHYQEIATWEPEYAKLNEVIKWSLLFSWMEMQHADHLVKFLGDVHVTRDLWFPDWAAVQGHRLTFQRWPEVHFGDRGQHGAASETLSVLQSQPFTAFGRSLVLAGGVSLASPADFATLSTLRKRVFAVSGDELRSDAPLMDPPAADTYVSYETNSNGAFATDIINGQPDSQLSVSVQNNSIRAIFQRRRAGQLSRLAQAIKESSSGRLSVGVMESEGVDVIVRLSDGQALIHFVGEDAFSVLDTTSNRQGKQAVADALHGHLSAWFGDNQYLVVTPDENPIDGFQGEIRNRGPPTGTTEEILKDGEKNIRAFRFDGLLHLARSDIPDDVIDNPDRLRRLISEANIPQPVVSLIHEDFSGFAKLASSSPQDVKNKINEYIGRGGELPEKVGSGRMLPIDAPAANQFLFRFFRMAARTRITFEQARAGATPIYFEVPSLTEPGWAAAQFRLSNSGGFLGYSDADTVRLPGGLRDWPRAIFDPGRGKTYVRADDAPLAQGPPSEAILVNRKP